ncbi:EH domain-containing protein 3 [Sarotherodon galilaeus]
MMLSLLLLLALASASPQDIVKKPSEDRNVTSLNPDLEDRAPEMTDISVNTSVYQHLLFPAKMKQKRQAYDNKGKVKWQTWNGDLPVAVEFIWNPYEKRFDVFCKHGCHAGFYTHSLGDFCHYPYGNKEYRTDSFDILVNENKFEILEWKEGSFGSVPANAVRTCSSDELYVGKNKYGLGKVHPRNWAFYLPWGGKEYWYWYYEVLTIKRDYSNELIHYVEYKINDTKMIRNPPSTLAVSTISNNGCNPVTKTVTLSESVLDDKWWDVGFLPLSDAPKTFQAKVPNLESGTIVVSDTDTILSFSEVPTDTREFSHSAKVQVSIPPNSYCTVKMLAYKYNVNIPFIASLARFFKEGYNNVPISGTFKGIMVGEVSAVVERCARLSSAQPCPS